MKKIIVAGAVACAVIGAATSYASPYITMHSMRSAIENHDADAFSSHVDFSALRENLKAQVMTTLGQKLASSKDQQNGFAALGMMLAVGMANQVIDMMVTPAGVMTMVAEGQSRPSAPKGMEAQASVPPAASSHTPSEYAVRYKDWSTVLATTKGINDEETSFVFKRDGLWSWKLAGVSLPMDKLLSR